MTVPTAKNNAMTDVAHRWTPDGSVTPTLRFDAPPSLRPLNYARMSRNGTTHSALIRIPDALFLSPTPNILV